jgi:hypothetical protein
MLMIEAAGVQALYSNKVDMGNQTISPPSAEHPVPLEQQEYLDH